MGNFGRIMTLQCVRPCLLHIARQGLRLFLPLVLFVLTGCATTREDDYVNDIIADALRQAEVATPDNGAEQTGRETVVPEAVPSEDSGILSSNRSATAVSVTPAGVVSLTIPSSVPDRGVAPVAPLAVSTGRTAAAAAPVGEPSGVVPSVGNAPVVAVTPDITLIPAAVPPPPASSVTTVTNVGRRQMVLLKPTIPTIQPNTVLWVSVDEDPSLTGRYQVGADGTIDLGYVGMVYVQDFAVEQAEVVIKNVLEGRYLKRATVKLRIVKASYDQVGMMGGVESAGEIRIGPGTAISLTDLLLRAGGLRGEKRNLWVKIVRGGLLTPFGPAADGETYPLSTPTGDLAIPNVFLRNNDLVYVFAQQAGTATGAVREGRAGPGTSSGVKRILLLGEVPRRGVVEFAENEPCSLMYLLFKIGGLPRFAKASKITVLRIDKEGREIRIVKNGETLMERGNPDDDIILESGDRVIVPARKFTFF